MTITLFVGDSDESIAKRAKQHSSDAFLVEYSNFEDFLQTEFIEDVTVYTAHSDLPKITDDRAVLYEILNKADVLYYSPPLSWSDVGSDFFLPTDQKSLTLYFLSLIHRQKNNVVNFDLGEYQNNNYINLVSVNNCNQNVVWSAGCSVAKGVGVNPHQRYANVVATHLNKPLIDLSQGGSSIEFAADQILRSDIKCNDIVVWGLTEEMRYPVWNSEKSQVEPGKYTRESVTETRTYKSVTSVHQVVNFCSKIGAKLILLPIICSEKFCLLLSGISDFYQLPYQTKFIDYGDDGIHPGPLQHKIYTDFFLDVIQHSR